MRIDPEDLRRHYESLSDEGLLEIDRADLVPVAQGIYDREIARRGLNGPPEQEEEAYDRGAPDDQTDEAEDFAGEPLPDEGDDGPPPAWLEDAGCPWSAYMRPGYDYAGNGAEVQAALRGARIPSRVVVKPPEPEAEQGPPPGLYCVMVPGDLSMRAYSVIQRKIFNPQAEADWRTHLLNLSDEQLRRLRPDDFCGEYLDKAERLKRAYLEEIARRNLEAAAR
jgi:hypothetical protein